MLANPTPTQSAVAQAPTFSASTGQVTPDLAGVAANSNTTSVQGLAGQNALGTIQIAAAIAQMSQDSGLPSSTRAQLLRLAELARALGISENVLDSGQTATLPAGAGSSFVITQESAMGNLQNINDSIYTELQALLSQPGHGLSSADMQTLNVLTQEVSTIAQSYFSNPNFSGVLASYSNLGIAPSENYMNQTGNPDLVSAMQSSAGALLQGNNITQPVRVTLTDADTIQQSAVPVSTP